MKGKGKQGKIERTGQLSASQERAVQAKTGQDRPSYGRHDKTGMDRTGQDGNVC